MAAIDDEKMDVDEDKAPINSRSASELKRPNSLWRRMTDMCSHLRRPLCIGPLAPDQRSGARKTRHQISGQRVAQIILRPKCKLFSQTEEISSVSFWTPKASLQVPVAGRPRGDGYLRGY